MYRYLGLHWACKLAIYVSLLSASVGSGHVAAWVGAQSRNAHTWVQAGVANEGSGTFVYAESNGASGYKIREIPWRLHRPVRVIIQHRGLWWRAGAGRIWTPWMRILGAVRCSTLELFANARGSAMIGPQLVK